METNKTILKELEVSGNIKDYTQKIEIYYYERDRIHTDKIVVYFLLTDGKKNYGKRSTYFSTLTDLRTFIYQLAYSYGYFKRKRSKYLDFSEDEIKLILKEIYEEMIRGWRNGYK